MNVSPFLAPFSRGTQKREAAAPKVSGCFMGGTCAVREEPGKQKPRGCRAQELARSSAKETAWQKKGRLTELSESWNEEQNKVSHQTRNVKVARLTLYFLDRSWVL